MKTTAQYEINTMNGNKKETGTIWKEFDDPVFLNMQFYVEREQYEKLRKMCIEYKLGTIHHAIYEMLNENDAESIACFISNNY